MASAQAARGGAQFIGTVERIEGSWRASFRLRLPSEVFAQQGSMEIFATELQAMKWLHSEAAARGFSSIEIERRTNNSLGASDQV